MKAAFYMAIDASLARDLAGAMTQPRDGEHVWSLSGGATIASNEPRASEDRGRVHNSFFSANNALGGSMRNYDDLGGFGVEDRSRGASYGVEMALKRRLTRRIGGMLTCSLSRAERWTDTEAWVTALRR